MKCHLCHGNRQGDKMSSCLRMNIFAGSENPFIKTMVSVALCSEPAKETVFPVMFHSDPPVWHFDFSHFVLSFFLSEWQRMCLCARVPTFKCAMRWKSPIIKGNILADVPSALKSISPLLGKASLVTFNLICLRFWSGKFLTMAPEETGKISTPKCSFQSAFLHVYPHLNDPSSADSCYRKNAIVILCKCIRVEYHKHSWLAVHCRMWILCALTLCWITNDVGLTCLLQRLLHKSCTLSCGIKSEQQYTFLLLTLLTV